MPPKLSTTLAVIVTQIRMPSYHGVAWQRLNPGLPEWRKAQAARSEK